ncbi:hypothetical protein I6H96_02430 [Brucella anthropi]|uniref:hypothetical protein n=1 Tax=Brucella anthropi TaxID=529 RepID=UPI00030B99A4|nr:hypothetical protein [Brucella anthropi]NKC48110.1 hypothetical protein [Brucella anthropi ATCC 49188]QQC25740.1 hypothetical protein I6H96_02430 [Brucella anthropi]RRY08805.1 hypothetical protein EGJ58_12960 [Brucella anthropi]SUA65580.1 Uncharacterised protein [Brucella anthropi]
MKALSEIITEARNGASDTGGSCLTFGINRYGDELLIVTDRENSSTFMVKGENAVLLNPLDKNALDRAREVFKCLE